MVAVALTVSRSRRVISYGLTGSARNLSQSQHVLLCQRASLAIRPHRLSRRQKDCASCVVYLGPSSLWRGIRNLYPATDYVVRYRGLNLALVNKLLVIGLSSLTLPMPHLATTELIATLDKVQPTFAIPSRYYKSEVHCLPLLGRNVTNPSLAWGACEPEAMGFLT